MTIEKIDGVWAETGDKESTLTDEKKAAGFTGGDKPPIERYNYLLNRLDAKADRIIEERINSFYDDATDHKLMMSTGLWSDSWGIGSDTPNTISCGATKEFRDTAVFFDADSNPRLLVIDNANCTIEVWDPRALTKSITTNALSDDLVSGGGETWEPYSMCTDGTSVYVMLADTNAAPDTHIIQAWTIDEDAADWDVKTGWPATGTALTGTGNAVSTNKDGRVIVADADYLACCCAWNTIGAASDPAIIIVDITDGTFSGASSGAGDAPQAGDTTDSAICSDGTNIFFGVEDGLGDIDICSATIANPQVGCGGANYPFSVAGMVGHQMVSCGPNMIVSVFEDGCPSDDLDVVIMTHSSTDADLDVILRGRDAQATPLDGDFYLMDAPWAVTYDGLYIWIVCSVVIGSDNSLALIKVDPSKLLLEDAANDRMLGSVATGPYLLLPDTVGTGGATNEDYLSVVSDGRDVWVNVEARASQTHSGKLIRLPLSLERF